MGEVAHHSHSFFLPLLLLLSMSQQGSGFFIAIFPFLSSLASFLSYSQQKPQNGIHYNLPLFAIFQFLFQHSELLICSLLAVFVGL